MKHYIAFVYSRVILKLMTSMCITIGSTFILTLMTSESKATIKDLFKIYANLTRFDGHERWLTCLSKACLVICNLFMNASLKEAISAIWFWL